MKLIDAPIGSIVKFDGNTAKVLLHGAMGCRVDITTSKHENISLGKQILSNESEVSLKAK